ncbi:MAG: hypothetical protein H6817_02190 [Phycisphaerales bacterium]|nr:hypothetical protein [Phycisphaerales bacterium]
MGYVAGVRVESEELFDAIHPHGHEVFIERTRCASCREAIKSNGFCTACHVGYLNEQAYFSRLAYILAQGETVDADDVTCPTCRQAQASTGWCATCAVGWFGNVRYRDREKFAEASCQHAVMMAALKAAPRCEFCAAAIITDERCYKCRIAYQNGKPVGSHRVLNSTPATHATRNGS